MDLCQELSDLSRRQLYVMIEELKEEINCLKTDLIKYKFVSNSFRKYFDFFSQINETIASNEEVLHSIKDINSLTEKKCFVALKRLNDNYLNESRVQRVEQKRSESHETIESQPTEREDTSDEIPDRKPIKNEIKIEDIEEVNKCFITDLLIEKKPNIEEIKDISINLKNNSKINVKSETNISKIEFNAKSVNQLNQRLKKVKTETQRNNSEDVSNESQKTNEAKDIEFIDITENDSVIEQAIDGSKIQISDKTHENNELNDTSFQPNDQILKDDNHLETRRHIPWKVFKCDVKGCEKVCHTSSGLLFHKNTHSDKYLCGINGCQHRAGSNSSLDRHKQSVHSNERPYNCVVNGCDIRFKTRHCLRTHQLRVHKIYGKSSDEPEIKPFDCLLKYCEKRFSSRKKLRKHMKKYHKFAEIE